MTNKKNNYRINGKIYKFIKGYDSPYSYIYVFQEIDTGEKFCIEEQSPEEIQEEKNANGIKD
jgi:hypothetical protein